MKISIGSNIIEGPWGGGNQFAISLSRYLVKKGWEVTTSLTDKDIDVIVMTEPRRWSESGSFTHKDVAKYLINKPDTLVIHRINNCDKSRKTNYINKYLIRANKVADMTVFISKYLKDIYEKDNGFKCKNSIVIKNGADKNIFNRLGRDKRKENSKFKLVTHHWSSNYNKGFDIYEQIDKLTRESIDGKEIEFNYIGNISDKIKLENTKIIEPLEDKRLSEEIKKNHIYITGAIGEGAGMHHIEGAMCGLPILFRNSGALPEYCEGFGVMFNNVEDVKEKLIELINNYDYYFEKMLDYPNNTETMCKEYEQAFLQCISRKNKINQRKRRHRYFKIFIKESFIMSVELIRYKFGNLIKKIYR